MRRITILCLVLLAFSVSTVRSQETLGGPYVADDNTMMLLHFDGDFANASTHSEDAVIHGTHFFLSNEALGLGQCLRLSNSTPHDSAYVTVPDNASLDLIGDWTIEGWVNIFTFGDASDDFRWVPRLVMKPGDEIFWQPNYWVEMWGDARLFQTGFHNADMDRWPAVTSPPNVFEPGKWTHLTFIRDTENHLLIQMVHDANRELVWYGAVSYDPVKEAIPVTTNQDVHIGWAGAVNIAEPSNDSWLDGFVDEIRISNVVRDFQIPVTVTGVTRLSNQSSEVSEYPVEATVKKIGAAGTVTGADLHYRVNAGSWQVAAMSGGGTGLYSAVIPGQNYGSKVEYYVSADDNDGYHTTDPSTAEAAEGATFYTFYVYKPNSHILSLNFDDGAVPPTDGSDYNHPIDVIGTVTPTDAGKIGKGMYFPGDSTRLEVDTPFLSSEEFTLDVWIRPDTMVAYSRIIFRPEDYAGWGNSAWAIRYEANNLITARFTQVGGGDNVIALDTPLELGKWYHLIYEVAAENSVFQLSDADDQVIEAKESPVTAKPINTTAPLRIGNAANVTGSPDWHDRSFRGVMDEFNFYNFAKGAENPAEPLGGPYVEDDNTMMLLHFDGDFANASTHSEDAVIHGTHFFLSNEALGLGQCLRLSNSTPHDSAYVTVPDNASLDLIGDWTIEGWVNIFTFGDASDDFRWVPRLVMKPGDEIFWQPNYWVEMWGDARLFQTGFHNADMDRWPAVTSPPNVFEPGKWTHLTFIRDTENHLLIQMVHDANRELVWYGAVSYDPVKEAIPVTTNQDVHIGWAGAVNIAEPSNDSWLDGFVDEIRISNVVRDFQIPVTVTGVTRLSNQSSEVSEYPVEATVKKIGAAGTVTGADLHYRVNAGSWQVAAMSGGGTGLYSAVIPGQNYGSKVEYYVSADDNDGYHTTQILRQRKPPRALPFTPFTFTNRILTYYR